MLTLTFSLYYAPLISIYIGDLQKTVAKKSSLTVEGSTFESEVAQAQRPSSEVIFFVTSCKGKK